MMNALNTLFVEHIMFYFNHQIPNLLTGMNASDLALPPTRPKFADPFPVITAANAL